MKERNNIFMKNNALKLLSLAIVLPMLTACPKPKKTVVTPDWDDEVQDAMELYCGEVLPFAELDEETLTYGYDADYSMFFLYDDSEENVLVDYEADLLDAGFEYTETDYYGTTYVSYDKENEIGVISVTFGWAEAEDDVPAGNFINVTVPQYLDEEMILSYGYEKQTGWPTQLVADTMEGSGLTITPVNAEGTWYVASTLAHDDDYGDWYVAYLITNVDCGEEFANNLLTAGCAYDEDWGCFYDPTYASDYELYVSVARNYTIIELNGQTLTPVVPTLDYQGDALDQAAFGLTDGATTYAEHTATGASGATYKAQCASAHGIQIRSKNSNSGILGTNTTKTCESITVLFDSNTQSGRTINVYGSNTEFTIADMYNSLTPVGTIVYGENAIVSYEFTAEFNYIGLRSADGAIYISGIDVVWSD